MYMKYCLFVALGCSSYIVPHFIINVVLQIFTSVCNFLGGGKIHLQTK